MKSSPLSTATAVLVLASTLGLATAGKAQTPPSGPSAETDQYVLCESRYALCDDAPCMTIPSQVDGKGSRSTTPDTALCKCSVFLGRNMGPGLCQNRSGPGDRQLMSTYSFTLSASRPRMTCPAGRRTFCYGAPCEISEDNPEKAHCACQIIDDPKPFVTMGGGCDTGKCGTTLWQGDSLEGSKKLNNLLAKAIGLEAPPDNNCPAGD